MSTDPTQKAAEALPHTLFARYSDNVLDEENWPVQRIVVIDGRVVQAGLVDDSETNRKKLAYRGWVMLGWTVQDLLDKVRHDPTGRHPEGYYEVSDDVTAWPDDQGEALLECILPEPRPFKTHDVVYGMEYVFFVGKLPLVGQVVQADRKDGHVGVRWVGQEYGPSQPCHLVEAKDLRHWPPPDVSAWGIRGHHG